MTLPLIYLTNDCKEKAGILEKNEEPFMAIDAALLVTSLVLGILSAVGVVSFPPAAMYSCFGVSAAIFVLWVGAITKLILCPDTELGCCEPDDGF